MLGLSTRRLQFHQLAVVVLIAACGPIAAKAHEGPPFAILMDQPVSGYKVSVWADPDIGEAQFYIIVEGLDGGPPAEIPEVSMWTEPVSGRLERTTYETTKQEIRNQLNFEAKPYFDQRDQWTVGFQITAPGKEPEELTTKVESTPPGYGLWDFVIYLFPFVFLGMFWMIAMRRRSQIRRLEAAGHAEPAPGDPDALSEDESANSRTGHSV